MFPYLLFADLNPCLDLHRQGNQAYPGFPTYDLRSKRILSLKEDPWELPHSNLSISALPLLRTIITGYAVAYFELNQPSTGTIDFSLLNERHANELHSAPLQASIVKDTTSPCARLIACFQAAGKRLAPKTFSSGEEYL